MNVELNIFLKKKILIYGLGKSGLWTFRFLKNKSNVFLFDDFILKVKNFNIKKRLINYEKILNSKFDQIILSPGIDINKCKLSRYLKRNYNKIYSDLDVFYAFFKNDSILEKIFVTREEVNDLSYLDNKQSYFVLSFF